LREIQRRNLPSLVVIVTQFETFGEGEERLTLSQLSEELAKEFPRHYSGTIYYHPAQSDWRASLLTKLGEHAAPEGSP
jgi:hypothetical protein